MRTSRRWLTVIAAGGLLIAGSPAIPAQAATSLQTSFHLCLKNANSYCLRFVTADNQETITSNLSDYGNFHIVNRRNGYTDFQIENGSGNCLRAADNNVVKIKNGGCSVDSEADWWFDPADALWRVESSFYHDYMLVHGHVDGWNVWHARVITGDWYNWEQA